MWLWCRVGVWGDFVFVQFHFCFFANWHQGARAVREWRRRKRGKSDGRWLGDRLSEDDWPEVRLLEGGGSERWRREGEWLVWRWRWREELVLGLQPLAQTPTEEVFEVVFHDRVLFSFTLHVVVVVFLALQLHVVVFGSVRSSLVFV